MAEQNNILNRLLELSTQAQQRTGQARNFADRLRDEREALTSGVIEQGTQVFEQPSPVVTNPIQDLSLFRQFLETAEKFREPAIEGEKIAAEAEKREFDILKEIAGLQGEMGSKPPTISEQIAAAKAGGTIEDGKFVPGKDDVKESAQDVLNLIKEIKQENTKPITGDIRLGGIPLITRAKVSATAEKVKRLNSLLQLAAAGKLKGQGQITEAERQILAESVSSLGLSEKGRSPLEDDDFRAELDRIAESLGGVAGGTTGGVTTSSGNKFIIEEE